MSAFEVRKFYAYRGPSYYLDRQALVFNLSVPPEGPPASRYREEVTGKLPALAEDWPDDVAEAFARTLVEVLRMDIGLFVNRYAISRDGDDHVIAVEYLDEIVAEDCARFVADWFGAMSRGREFEFDTGFEELQQAFDRTLFGGPTIYSLIEAGLRRDIPVLYMKTENQFMWGYGRKHVRGRSTTFHTDSIKDTEFTTFKDRCKEFLLTCGFPTPLGRNCFTEEQAVEEAREQGFPVVVKPVAGHKGQGVTTGIESEKAVREAFRKIAGPETAADFAGAIVERQVYGTDHRLLAVDGRFVAALERVPAYVDGNGRDTIRDLIAVENDTVARLDNARSPLTKIRIDDDLVEYLGLQDMDLETVPPDGERVFLRRVANISQGGVSINVTEKIHPANVHLVEDIAKYFRLTCLGIDVLADDIGKPWNEGNFGIIEINAGPGVFMHLAPAQGGSIDVPGKVIGAHFPKPGSERIPIVAGNRITPGLVRGLGEKVRELRPEIEVGGLTPEGVHFDGRFFGKLENHTVEVTVILRSPRLGFAVLNHGTDDIYDHGTVHQGADVVVLEEPSRAEETLARDLLPGGDLVRVTDSEIVVTRDGLETVRRPIGEGEDKETVLVSVLSDRLEELVGKYE